MRTDALVGSVLLIVNIYFDSSIPLWQQLYKDGNVNRESGCEQLENALSQHGAKCYHPSTDRLQVYAPTCHSPKQPQSGEETAHGREAAFKVDAVCFCGDETCNESEWCHPNGKCSVTICEPFCEKFKDGDDTRIMCQADICGGCKGCPEPTPPQPKPAPPQASVQVRRLGHDSSKLPQTTSRWQVDGVYVGKSCSYYCERDAAGNRDSENMVVYWRKPHSFSKGFALGLLAILGTCFFYVVNYFHGGKEQLYQCFEWWRLLKFGPVGICFGLGAVFSFLAQQTLSPGSYALFAQTGVVVIPIVWRLVFCRALAYITWLHICIIAAGIVIYFTGSGNDGQFSASSRTGLFWIVMKVGSNAAGTIGAEVCLKSSEHPPLAVSMACMLPWKALGCFLTCPILEWDEFQIWYAHRDGAIFHDWSGRLFLVLCHNLGDTCMSGVVAFFFDSVVKAICGVVGIIFPTWAISLLMGWDKINLQTSTGAVRLGAGVVVIVGAFAYALGRHMAAQLEEAALKTTLTNSLVKSRSNIPSEAASFVSKQSASERRSVMVDEIGLLEADMASRRDSLRASHGSTRSADAGSFSIQRRTTQRQEEVLREESAGNGLEMSDRLAA